MKDWAHKQTDYRHNVPVKKNQKTALNDEDVSVIVNKQTHDNKKQQQQQKTTGRHKHKWDLDLLDGFSSTQHRRAAWLR